MSTLSHPIAVPEFRSAENSYFRPVLEGEHEIIRPKPRRPLEASDKNDARMKGRTGGTNFDPCKKASSNIQLYENQSDFQKTCGSLYKPIIRDQSLGYNRNSHSAEILNPTQKESLGSPLKFEFPVRDNLKSSQNYANLEPPDKSVDLLPTDGRSNGKVSSTPIRLSVGTPLKYNENAYVSARIEQCYLKDKLERVFPPEKDKLERLFSPEKDKLERVFPPEKDKLDRLFPPEKDIDKSDKKFYSSETPPQKDTDIYVQQFPERDNPSHKTHTPPQQLQNKYLISKSGYPDKLERSDKFAPQLHSEHWHPRKKDILCPSKPNLPSYNVMNSSRKDSPHNDPFRNSEIVPKTNSSCHDRLYSFLENSSDLLPSPCKKEPSESPCKGSNKTEIVLDGCESVGTDYKSANSDPQVPNMTYESTDCGSLGKSSSDGAPIFVRKRPSSKAKSRRRNILSFPQHLSVEEMRLMQRYQETLGESSSDENRSSGHASMTESHSSGGSSAVDTWRPHTHYRSALKAVPEDDRLAQPLPARRVRGKPVSKDDLWLGCEASSGLENIKEAIEQLTLRSQGSYSTSTYSSMSGSESEARRLLRHSSLDTINTNVTVADEFVWLDSHNRLVELQQVPWSSHDILRVIQNGRLRDEAERVAMETVPRLSYLLQRAMVRVSREAQRLSRPLGMCSKREIATAFRIILSPAMADSCNKACLRSAAMYAVSGDQFKQSKSGRAGLHFSLGRFYRWMVEIKLGNYIQEYSAVYLAAGMENLLEEVILHCLPPDSEVMLTAAVLEHAIASSGEMWGLLQPYAHLNSGRNAAGILTLPRWPSSTNSEATGICAREGRSMEQCMLTTCVGSLPELCDLLSSITHYHCRRMGKNPVTWSVGGINTLFYFMRCSQLEHAERRSRVGMQELVYERPYVVLPPLIEWVRVSIAHTEYRTCTSVDSDDVMQAARLLLPGLDCPIRIPGLEGIWSSGQQVEDTECARKMRVDLAFKMLGSGRADLFPHALQLLPVTKVNTVNDYGLTPLMVAASRGEEGVVRMLLDGGADVNAETPPNSAHPETQHWTALTYSSIHGHVLTARLLLERGASVEGGARLNEEKCTQTPLQVAAATGNLDMISLLLAHGAQPFLSTLLRDSLCYSGAAQRGCYSSLSVAAAHGQRHALQRLLSQPCSGSNKEMLSLEEILAEGSNQKPKDLKSQALTANHDDSGNTSGTSLSIGDNTAILNLSKSQMKLLQEAMYHTTENGYLDLTLELRGVGVPWTLHCWMHTLATAQSLRLDSIIDQLLQDFLTTWPDSDSTQFIEDGLPLLFSIFRHCKKEGTSLLLADIFSTCFGREGIKHVQDKSPLPGIRAAIDPSYVNNPEMSDVQFRVESRVFYAHKIILVNASSRFKQMLSSRFCEGNPPIVQINDIRYNIFELVMQYLYKGGCDDLQVEPADVLELLAAANFFQLFGLVEHCESKCASMVDVQNVVSMYIHAKVYNAGQLLEFCQGFLLQNMVALLTYDDSARRLIFGKKLHNHDVLEGLLLTLQNRIKDKKSSHSCGKKD